jgi:hypothetical protein
MLLSGVSDGGGCSVSPASLVENSDERAVKFSRRSPVCTYYDGYPGDS